MGLKQFGREIIFRRIPTYVITVPERYRQTDRRTGRQTDDMHTHNRADCMSVYCLHVLALTIAVCEACNIYTLLDTSMVAVSYLGLHVFGIE